MISTSDDKEMQEKNSSFNGKRNTQKTVQQVMLQHFFITLACHVSVKF